MGKPTEFPMLEGLGLYAVPTTGYGNCLFAAFSDQLYGDESHHLEIRARVVEFMRLNGAYFKPFTAVNIGGGERRNTRRSNAGRYASTFDFNERTADDVDHQFELKLRNLAQSGEYGDQMAILAFSGAYGVVVRVHQAETACDDVSAVGLALEGTTEAANGPLMAHIAYHDHQHYSSVRRIHNQHEGLMTSSPAKATTEVEDKDAASSAQSPPKVPTEAEDDVAACSSPSGSSQRDRSASDSSASDVPPATRLAPPRWQPLNYKEHEKRSTSELSVRLHTGHEWERAGTFRLRSRLQR